MPTTVTMPQLGETVTEGTILSWMKQVGDTIGEDDVLVEISTDKVDTEVPSPAAGVILEILVPEGETVEVGTALAIIGDAADEPAPGDAPEPQPAAAPSPQPEQPTVEPVSTQPPAAQPSAAQPPSGEPTPAPEPAPAAAEQAATATFLSPVVRKLAREHNVDLSQVPGTGQEGRITRRDVEAFLASQEAAPTAPTEAPAPADSRAPTPPIAAPPTAAPEVVAPAVSPAPATVGVPTSAADDTVDLDRLRARIGENMIKAKQTAAHVWTSVEVDYERVERVRKAHKERFKAEEGFSLTYLPFIARATIDALHEYPVVNSSFFLEERKAVFHRTVNLGIAIDLNQKGLVVATIHNAEGLRLIGLARQIRVLADKARGGSLEPDDVTGSTFTLTNPGPFGSFMSAPIINVPNTGILSTDTVAKRPAVVTAGDGSDTIAIRHIGYLGLSWDHRAWDGSTAVLFLQRIKQNLEGWDWEQELA